MAKVLNIKTVCVVRVVAVNEKNVLRVSPCSSETDFVCDVRVGEPTRCPRIANQIGLCRHVSEDQSRVQNTIEDFGMNVGRARRSSIYYSGLQGTTSGD